MTNFKAAIIWGSICISCCSSAFGETPTDKAEKIISEAKQSCVSDGGQFSTNEDALQAYEFKTENALEELVIVNEYGFECSLAYSYYQGSAGAVVHLITPNDYKYGYARGVEITKMSDDIPVILLSLHGSSCGVAGYQPCLSAITLFEGQLLNTK